MKSAFYFILKALFILKILKFYLDFLGMQRKRLDQKGKVNFEIYDVTAWLTKNCKTHYSISHELKATRQRNLVSQQNIPREIFFCKSYAENEEGKLVPDHFLFFKKASYQVKASGLQLDFTIFRQPSNQHTIEKNCLKLYPVDPQICSILIFQIRAWKQFLQNILCMIFQRKCFSCYILSTDQIFLPSCLS